MDHITIVGKSRTGRSLALAIRRSAGIKLSALIPARQKKYPQIDSEIIIIATKDKEIPAVAAKAVAAASKNLKLIVHLAGSLPSTILPAKPGVSRITLHPIQTFPKPSAHLLRDITWMASSDDPASIRWAKRFTSALGGGGLLVLPTKDLPLYHTITVLGSNFVTLLYSAIEQITDKLGLPQKRVKAALRQLAQKSLENALTNPAESVLSGPIARQDFTTIDKHRNALKSLDPRILAIYEAFLEYGVTLGTPKR